MSEKDTIVIGASAGGVEALSRLVRYLPSDLQAALFVVVHFPATSISHLPRILSRAGRLPAVHPQDGDRVEKGMIYVAPPNLHLMIHDGAIRLVHGPREHGLRPSIDALFRSAAESNGAQVIGVVLTGTRSDGVAGLVAIKQAGGIAVVQDPDEALFSDMPLNAIRKDDVDYILPVAEIGPKLVELIQTSSSPHYPPKSDVSKTSQIQEDIMDFEEKGETSSPTVLTCPECGGVLWEDEKEGLLYYSCHVGHTFSSDSLLDGQTVGLEATLWSSLRRLKERAILANRQLNRDPNFLDPDQEAFYRRIRREADDYAEALRDILYNFDKKT